MVYSVPNDCLESIDWKEKKWYIDIISFGNYLQKQFISFISKKTYSSIKHRR